MSTELREKAEAYARLFNTLSPADVARLGAFFHPDARFKDPFNDVSGVTAIQHLFRHMFYKTVEPRFRVRDWGMEGAVAYYHWDFSARLSTASTAAPLHIVGMSRVEFDSQGRVQTHIDYWDPVDAVFSRVPLLGSLLRFLSRRLSVG